MLIKAFFTNTPTLQSTRMPCGKGKQIVIYSHSESWTTNVNQCSFRSPPGMAQAAARACCDSIARLGRCKQGHLSLWTGW